MTLTGRPTAAELGRVAELEPGDLRWDAYVRAHGAARPYHLAAWAHVLRRSYGVRPAHLALLEGETVRGVLPLAAGRGLAGARLRSLPAVPPAGPLADTHDGALALVRAACDRADGRGAALTIRSRRGDLAVPGMAARETYPSLVLALGDDPDALRRAIRKRSSNLHRNLQKAERAPLTVHASTERRDVRAFYGMYERLMRRKGALPRPRRQIADDVELLGGEGVTRLWMVEHEGRVIAGALFHTLGDTTVLLLNASDPEHLGRRPNHALYWHVVRHSIDEGLAHLDFGEARPGSELERFKRQWGAEPVPEFRYDYVPGGAPLRADALRTGASGGRTGGLRRRVWQRTPLPALRAASGIGYRLI